MLLEPEIQKAIVDSEITITAKESLGITGTETENIIRKVFLLSYTELGFTDNAVVNEEGKALKYFDNPDNRIARRNKKPSSWWLRSSDTWEMYTVCGIGPTGTCGGGSVNFKNGVRPAFCLNNTLAVEPREDVLAGQTVYVIVE